MMLRYKGYGIKLAPYFLTELKVWSSHGYIVEEIPNATVEREFDAGRGYESKQDAEADFFHYACDVIERGDFH